MRNRLMEYCNRLPRLGCLATANAKGEVDAAYFGSPLMVDPDHLVLGLARNRTFAYLQENPQAVFLILEPGAGLTDWKGVRLYLRMIACATEGDRFDQMKAHVAAGAGEAAAKWIHAAVTLVVTDIRPLADFGQGWEQSIA